MTWGDEAGGGRDGILGSHPGGRSEPGEFSICFVQEGDGEGDLG